MTNSIFVALATIASAVAVVPAVAQTPVDQFLIANRDSEIAMARSAAPEAIAGHATVLVLTRHGYEVAVTGTNGWVCMVERSWNGAVDFPEFWNLKIHSPDCLNAQAARFLLPLENKRSAMFMAGRSQAEMNDAVLTALAKREIPALEPGAMGYMMSKAAYLTDSIVSGRSDKHNFPHLMFWVPQTDSNALGADVPHSPVVSQPFWTTTADPRLKNLPPVRIFMVIVSRWSDGADRI